MAEDYSKAPVSVGERRAEKNGHYRDWSPRDMLVMLLREMDSGDAPIPDHAIVVMGYREDDPMVPRVRYMRAGTMNILEQVGMLHDASRDFLE